MGGIVSGVKGLFSPFPPQPQRCFYGMTLPQMICSCFCDECVFLNNKKKTYRRCHCNIKLDRFYKRRFKNCRHLPFNKNMDKACTPCSPLRRNQIVAKTLDIRLKAGIARDCFKWGMINAVVLIALLVDISSKCRFFTSYWYWLEYCIACVSGVSLVTCLMMYLWYALCGDEVKGTEAQKILLTDRFDTSFQINESFEDVSSPKKKNEKDATLDDPSLANTIIKWHSSFEDSNWSYNRTSSFRHSPSPARGMQGIPQQQQNMSMNNSSFYKNASLDASGKNLGNSFVSQYAVPTRDDFIQDERSLNAYLNERTRRQLYQAELPADMHQSNVRDTSNSFWNYCNSAAVLLKSGLYQLAPQTTTQHKPMANEDGGTMHLIDTNSEVIQRIATDKLSKYIANLRMWISTTILQRLVEEFENVNQIFRQRGFLDIKIGAVSLDRLRKTAENQQFVNQCAPMLPVLLSFLDLTNNQEYLVRRIKQLAKGSCIANFCWNSGGDYNGNKWSEHLPTDTAILFHVFCVYLDSQLMPLPQGGGRPFHSRYVLIRKDKRSTKEIVASVNNKAQCGILCVEPLKPKLNFISNKEIHACSYDRNNLFYVIIHFLIYMRTHQFSMLEGINLGKGGINIMCVIDD